MIPLNSAGHVEEPEHDSYAAPIRGANCKHSLTIPRGKL